MNKTRYAMILLVAMASIGAYAVLSTATVAYAHVACDESAGPTGNPHTCDTPKGDPHEDNGNPDTGNPHNT